MEWLEEMKCRIQEEKSGKQAINWNKALDDRDTLVEALEMWMNNTAITNEKIDKIYDRLMRNEAPTE